MGGLRVGAVRVSSTLVEGAGELVGSAGELVGSARRLERRASGWLAVFEAQVRRRFRAAFGQLLGSSWACVLEWWRHKLRLTVFGSTVHECCMGGQ